MCVNTGNTQSDGRVDGEEKEEDGGDSHCHCAAFSCHKSLDSSITTITAILMLILVNYVLSQTTIETINSGEMTMEKEEKYTMPLDRIKHQRDRAQRT